jgi:4-hydroxy-tetrahydrodipicolinate reductase
MKLALIGYGKMGREIAAAAHERGDLVVKTFDIDSPADAAALADADVCIEFSTPQTVMQNIRIALEAEKDIVVGTTGWYAHLPELRDAVRRSGLLYSPNFSIGVNITYRIVAAAAQLMNNVADYDHYIH